MRLSSAPEVVTNPEQWRCIGEEVREQLNCKRAEFRRIRLIRGKYVCRGDALAKPVAAPLWPSLLSAALRLSG